MKTQDPEPYQNPEFRKNVPFWGVLLKGPSKAFDCLPHELINTKLKAYGLPLLEFKLVSYFLLTLKSEPK